MHSLLSGDHLATPSCPLQCLELDQALYDLHRLPEGKLWRPARAPKGNRRKLVHPSNPSNRLRESVFANFVSSDGDCP